jgi:hypothetical protein
VSFTGNGPGGRDAAIQGATLSRVNEVIFVVEEAAEGGYTARALGISIFTESHVARR